MLLQSTQLFQGFIPLFASSHQGALQLQNFLMHLLVHLKDLKSSHSLGHDHAAGSALHFILSVNIAAHNR